MQRLRSLTRAHSLAALLRDAVVRGGVNYVSVATDHVIESGLDLGAANKGKRQRNRGDTR